MTWRETKETHAGYSIPRFEKEKDMISTDFADGACHAKADNEIIRSHYDEERGLYVVNAFPDPYMPNSIEVLTAETIEDLDAKLHEHYSVIDERDDD
jgi:hypothetical protein